MKLHMGFEDTPYDYQRRGTSRVADLLEERYGVVSTFYDIKEPQILEILAKSVDRRIESLSRRRPSKTILLRTEAMKIESLFRQAINRQQFDGVITGVPTAAAVKSRKRGGRGSGRSFVRSGAYRDAFRVWAD